MKRFENVFRKQPRVTKMRSRFLAILESGSRPLAEEEIRKALDEEGIKVNKTSIYRAAQYFTQEGKIVQIDFGDGKKRYEPAGVHHHHLVCIKCKQVDDIQVGDDVDKIEKFVKRQKHFNVIRHSLEFFGVCKNCNN